MLVEVYVRDLISLILENAQNKSSSSFSTLYVRLSTQLRALGSLGVTTEKCAAILFPMVESSLPEEILVAWQRYRHQQPINGNKPTSEFHLEKLMEFIKLEVEGTERIRLARQPFSSSSFNSKGRDNRNAKPGVAAAANLVSSEENRKSGCVFCEGKHASEVCRKAISIPVEDRRKMVKDKRRCYICLSSYHRAKKCTENVKCIGCGRKHYAILCTDIGKHEKDKKPEDQKKDKLAVDVDLCNTISLPDVPLQTVVLRIQSDTTTKVIRGMLDSGSTRSYVLKSLAKDLGLKQLGHRETIHKLFGGRTERQHHYRYRVRMLSMDSKFSRIFEVDDQPTICNHFEDTLPQKLITELQLKGIKTSDQLYRQESSEIQVLFGNDVFGRLLTGNKVDLNCGITALETSFGWTLSGSIPKEDPPSSFIFHVRDLPIQNLWLLDVIGIQEPMKEKNKQELQEAAMEFFKKTVKQKEDGRYVVNLPWIEGHEPIPNYRAIAEKKLQSNKLRLEKLGALQAYHNVFTSWEEDGVIERVNTGTGHYLSHHGVMKPESETTPVRPVFNASFKSKGNPSLNSCLEVGPNMLEEIPVILTRFRMGLVGVTSDIKKAFLQIEIDEKDRDYVRCRVVFGVSSSPFLLQATLDHHLSKAPVKYQDTAQLLKKSFYVDNCCALLPTIKEALKFKEESVKLLATAMMDLRCWEIGPSEQEKNVPVLGLTWNLKKDILSCDLRGTFKKMEEKPITKRKILSIAHSIFDPTGIACAFTIIPKMLLQETCRIKAGWDTALPEDITRRFSIWMKQIPELEKLQVPRCLARNQDRNTWSLHIFSDSSRLAFATCGYLRSGLPGNIEVQLVMARSRVAPLKDTTIPRLELVGSACGARLAAKIKDMMGFDMPTTLWTDSTTALAWIKNERNWSVFVTGRVKEIRNISNTENWRHVPGKVNPADIPSRGATVKALIDSAFWEGPGWLKLEPETWPKAAESENNEEVMNELKKTVVSHVNSETVESTEWTYSES